MFSLFNWQISLGFVAAILTIIGYSINDTIVIFDRVRELVDKGSGKESFAFKVTQANNESFSRTIIISLIVLVSVTVLAVFGGYVDAGSEPGHGDRRHRGRVLDDCDCLSLRRMVGSPSDASGYGVQEGVGLTACACARVVRAGRLQRVCF